VPTEEQKIRDALSAIEIISQAIKSVTEKDKKILLERAIRKASIGDATYTVKLLTEEAGLDMEELDKWSSRQSHEILTSFLDNLARKLRFTLAIKLHPDSVPEILAGDQSGLVYLPPEMIRVLYAVGEAVQDVLNKEGGGDRVEFYGKKLLELSAEWVRENRKRWGLPSEWRLTQVREKMSGEGPLIPEDLPF
jgi:hypothetical protein